jgi:hypothetical protein
LDVPRPSSRRIERLVQDLRALEDLSRRARAVSASPQNGGELPNAYLVTLRLRGVTQVSTDDLPRFATRFSLRVELPAGYPFTHAPVCRLAPGSSPVFHPHFTPWRFLFGGGEWEDYRSHDPAEGVASLVLRIAHSLRYEPAYIRDDARQAANPEALQWYLRWKDAPLRLFPTDHAPLPRPEEYAITSPRTIVVPQPESSKTFVIQPAVSDQAPAASPAPVPKRFQVENATPPYTPVAVETPPFEVIPELGSDYSGPREVSHEVYIRSSAMRQIFAHIGWRRPTEENRNEQGGILLGRLQADLGRGVTYAIVGYVVTGETALGSRSHLQVGHDTWKTMLDRADEIMDAHAGVEILGWYHTHPNHLDVFMSETDLRTQERVFSGRWQCAVVLNPHRRRWKVFIGPEAEECPGFVVRGDAVEQTPDYPGYEAQDGTRSVSTDLRRTPRVEEDVRLSFVSRFLSWLARVWRVLRGRFIRVA